ncbi:MAG TPA: serine hydrolase domain-containing protein [Gammaproteobacteria bacterium]
MSSERLSRVDDALNREIAEGRMPGGVLAVTRRGKLVYYEAFGYLDVEANIAMPRDAIFSIASMTKPIVAIAALTLYEQGRLLLQAPIGTYLPELRSRRVSVDHDPSRTVSARRQPTAQDLMRHTAGIGYAWLGDTPLHRLYPGRDSWERLTGSEFIAELGKLPLHHEPGTAWDYGYGLDVLAVIIERITGVPHGQYFAETIFEPLGMVDTAFTVPPEKASRHVKPLPVDPVSGQPQSQRDHSRYRFHCGSGCLVSTALDYLAFAQMLLDGGELNGKRVLGQRTVEYMTADHADPGIDMSRLYDYASIPDDGYGFGLGVAVRRDTGLGGSMGSPGEFHWYGATGTLFRVDPQEELVIVYMAHTPGEIRGSYRELIPALVYQAIDD